jgi:hypothetical protein
MLRSFLFPHKCGTAKLSFIQIYIYMTPAIATLCLFYCTPSFSFSLLTTCFGPPGHHQVSSQTLSSYIYFSYKHSVAIAGVIYIYICIYTQQDATHRNKRYLSCSLYNVGDSEPVLFVSYRVLLCGLVCGDYCSADWHCSCCG